MLTLLSVVKAHLYLQLINDRALGILHHYLSPKKWFLQNVCMYVCLSVYVCPYPDLQENYRSEFDEMWYIYVN